MSRRPWLRLPPDLPLAEVGPWYVLLNAWDDDREVTEESLRDLTHQGAGTVRRLMARVLVWATTNGASVPDVVRGRKWALDALGVRSGRGVAAECRRSEPGVTAERPSTVEPAESTPNGVAAEWPRSAGGVSAECERSAARAGLSRDQRSEREILKGGFTRATPDQDQPVKLTVPTTWAAVESNPDGLMALPWDMLTDSGVLSGLRAAGVSVAGLRRATPDEVAKTGYLSGARGRTLIARLEEWGLVGGDLAVVAAESVNGHRTAEPAERSVAEVLAEHRRKQAAEKQAGGRP